ncbi:flocculation protein FLO11-like isoform X2 [Melopsittacus undulatus]|uniref:flocculation protein FLO11-like isoform X2 n=1 Tax=Melopsittacus undulatus TaxID=13146 RepID=UPI00146AE657|nr:flocculation protein FLO11-like isoform X2 [Melopsittacus undulatus]
MEGTRRALLRLAAACCLLCALPGECQKTAEMTPAFLSTEPTSHQPREASAFSAVTGAIPKTSLERNLTAATLNATGAHATEMEDASIPTTPMVGTKEETLQASTTASTEDVTVAQHEHHNMILSVNSSTEILSPVPTASTLEESQPHHDVPEPFNTTEEMEEASSATPTPPLSSVTASNSSQPFGGQTMGPTAATSETRPGTSPVGATEESATEESTTEPRTSSAPISSTGSMSSATASSTATVRPLVTSSSYASTAAIPTSTPTLEQALEPMHEKASVLDVGDDENPELPSSPLADTTKADPLVITVISVFIVMVGILGLVGFLRYRQHNSRMEFRRLQDLPMDDMMEDTPLSLYSY